MANLKRTRYTLIGIVVVLFLVSIVLAVYAGINPQIAIIDSLLDSLQISYNLIPLAAASKPLIFASKLLDAAIFPILTVILAAWLFDFINSINLKERAVLSKLKGIKDHVIVVPSNSFARCLLQEFKNSGIKVVAIAENRREMRQLHNENEFAIAGDIKSMETFEIAGINRAKCLVTCSKDDVQNALIAITAKTANPHIKIIARADIEENAIKLIRAGAHKVIVPGKTAGLDMGNEIIKHLFAKKPYRKS